MKKSSEYGKGHIARLKDRFKLGKVSREEIIELMLSYVIRGRDVKPQAKTIYARSNGSFRHVFDVVKKGYAEGIGEQAEIFFGIINEFVNCYMADSFLRERKTINSQEDVVDYFQGICALSDKEETHGVFLDAKNGVMAVERLSEGTITQSLMYPREIVKLALKHGALSIIVIHNHPSGDTAPSQSDIKTTKRLYFALREMDMNLMDHIIIGTKGKGWYSFEKNGIISSFREAYACFMQTV